jgi:hypothetical protein
MWVVLVGAPLRWWTPAEVYPEASANPGATVP